MNKLDLDIIIAYVTQCLEELNLTIQHGDNPIIELVCALGRAKECLEKIKHKLQMENILEKLNHRIDILAKKRDWCHENNKHLLGWTYQQEIIDIADEIEKIKNGQSAKI